MNKKILVSAITAATLAIGSASAFADPRAPRGDDRKGPQKQQVDKRHRHDAQDHRRHGARPDHRHAPIHQTVIVQRGKPAHAHPHRRGAGPRHDLYRGSRLPAHYRTTHYVVRDWHAHSLHRPPQGHRWVQVGTDYLLIAVATGVITNLILGH
ncbi:MAG TPA: RcnB family protein [Burkholderiaceae bacterium]|nr:RcnB family protein [Burkholderiaceae bacterium]